MRKNVLIALMVLTSAHCFADAPLAPPAEVRKCDIGFSYCIYSDATQSKTTIFRIEGAFEKSELYTVDGWFRNPFISTDGKYFVAGYGGLNLIPKNYSPDLVVVTIYEDGKLLRELKLKEIFHTLESLEETVSHYHWGGIVEVGDSYVMLETTGGEVYLDIPTDKLYLP